MSILHCPYCHAEVLYGVSPCNTCGINLDWSALPDGFQLRSDDGHDLEIIRNLGRGGFGVTYLAQMLSGRRVAIKECFPNGLVMRTHAGSVQAKSGCEQEFDGLLSKFLLEARLLQDLEHPVSTAFIACWQANNTAYLMMEFIDGETLEARIARSDYLSELEAITLLDTILDLLEEVHARQLLHRDIKPANIMLTAQGVELIDFGSILKFDPQRSTSVTSKILTPAYAPLELYGSQVRLGPSSDLYSLAASIYEAVCGVRVPSALDRANGILVKSLKTIRPSLSSGFSKLIARALEMRIDDRFGSAQEMRAALRGPTSFTKPVKSTSNTSFAQSPSGASLTNIASTQTTQGSKPSRPIWTLAHWRWFGIVGGIMLVVFSVFQVPKWLEASATTRIVNELFQDQCEGIRNLDRPFTCTVSIRSWYGNRLAIVLSLGHPDHSLGIQEFKTMVKNPEFIDFTYDLAGLAITLFGVKEVEIQEWHEQTNSNFVTITERSDQQYWSQPTSQAIRELRNARALQRSEVSFDAAYFDLILKYILSKSGLASIYGTEVNRLYLKQRPEDGLTIFLGHRGGRSNALKLAANTDFRRRLREAIFRFHEVFPGFGYVALFVGTVAPELQSVWYVNVSNQNGRNEFDQLRTVNEAQLNDLWGFSIHEPLRRTNNRATNAWIVPVNTQRAQNSKPILTSLALLQISRQHEQNLRPPKPANEFTISIEDSSGHSLKASNVDFRNTKLILICCDTKPNQQFSVGYEAYDSQQNLRTQNAVGFAPSLEPPSAIRLRLTDDGSKVVIESEPLAWAKGYVVQITSEQGSFVGTIEQPTNNFIVPLKKFGARTNLRMTALNFNSNVLTRKGLFQRFDLTAARPLSASALETGPLSRNLLIGLKDDETLEFSRAFKWVVRR